MEYRVKILAVHNLTKNIKRFLLEKPTGYSFAPGQAADIAIPSPQFKDKKRPFTITSLNKDEHLELTIKSYGEESVTSALHELKPDSEIILSDPFGTLQYRGPGLFIAGGTGITPFLAMFRQLSEDKKLTGNTLMVSNKTQKDIIAEEELIKRLGKNAFFHLTQEKIDNYQTGRINKEHLSPYASNTQNFYICGPTQFVVDMKKALDNLEVNPDNVVIEI